MDELRQSVYFTSSFDGVRLAYGIAGRGHPLVRVPNWISHIEHDWQSPVMRHLVLEMASRHKLVNYDCRGVGMSERDVSDMSFDAWVHDLEAVVDAAKLERFALWGISGAPAVAIAYAVRHPGRVSHLVLCGGFCRGRLRRDASAAAIEKARVMMQLIEQGWGTEEPAFRQVFTSLPGRDGGAMALVYRDDAQGSFAANRAAHAPAMANDRRNRSRPPGALPDAGVARTPRCDRAV